MVWRWGRAAVALAATAWMLGCKSGVLDKTSGTIAIDGGRVGTADSNVIGPG